MTDMATRPGLNAIVSREAIEDFLFEEAAMLDEWRLDDWVALFTADATYQVPATDAPPDARPDTHLFYIADDRYRIQQRAERLKKKTAHSEFPRSKTRRMIANVRVRGVEGDKVKVTSNFVTYRSKNGVTDTYVGHHEHSLVRDGNGFRIAAKRTVLDQEALRPHGRISLIL